MVRPGPAAAAAAEERQRKLQEYLAAKGKLKDQNTKPYLKAKNYSLNPSSSKSTTRPKKDVTNHAVVPVKTTRPLNIKLQAKPANIRGSQMPKLEPPKPPGIPGKRPPLRCVSSARDCPQSSRNQQKRGAGSPTRARSVEPRKFPTTQEAKTKKQQETGQGDAKRTESVTKTHVESKSMDNFLKEMDKENVPQTLLDPDREPDPELRPGSKPETTCRHQTKNILAPKQLLGNRSVNSTVLKDRVHKQFVAKTQIRTLPAKSQQPSSAAGLTRPREKPPRTGPSHTQPPLRTQAAQKPVLQDTKDVQVNRGKHGRPSDLQPCPTAVQVKPANLRAHPPLLQGGPSRQASIKCHQKTVQPRLGPQASCILRKSRPASQQPNLTTGRLNATTPHTPHVRAKGASSQCSTVLQQKAQTVNAKKALPHTHFLNKTAPRTQAGVTTINGKGAPSATQVHPNVGKKTAAEARRKQLEEWQKSKGKIYKRPPMELKTKRKIIEEMNISFWKSMEKEEEEKKAQLELSSKINNMLSECLRLIEEGVLPDEISSILSTIPEAEKFAKFWICKAKLLASKGNFDAIGLYEEAIKKGATPIQELREVVLHILQDPSRTTRAGTHSGSSATTASSTAAEQLAKEKESAQSGLCPEERTQAAATPQTATEGIKLQIAAIPRICGMPEVQDMKLITPVRRSARIERSVSRYPEMLQDHDVVVASLDELLEVEGADCFLFRRNEALPVTLGFKGLESSSLDPF